MKKDNKRTKKAELHIAVKKGRLDLVKSLIEEKHYINEVDSNGYAPLHLAVENGYLEIVEYLIDKGADLNVEDEDDRTPLHLAAYNGHLGIVKYLIKDKKADFTVTDVEEMSPLHLAAENGHLDIVKYLLKEKQDQFNMPDCRSRLPVHKAAANGHLDVVKYLIDEVMEPLFVDDIDDELDRIIIKKLTSNGKVTPKEYILYCITLCVAAENGHLNVVKYLVDDKKTDITIKTGNIFGGGRNALHWAAYNGHLDVVKYLVDDKEANINVKDDEGRTTLYLADYNDHEDVVKYLIDNKGADIKDDMDDDEINLLLTDATKQGNLDKIKELIVNGADFRIEDNDNKTLLHYAAENGHLDVVQYCINEEKADVTAKTYYGWAPLHFAAQNGSLEVVKYLVEKGANVNAESGRSMTPLFRAFNFNVALYLIEKGAERKNVIWFDMLAPVVSFTGRSSELTALHDKLQSQATAIIGLGGVGKSELVRKYVFQYYKYYDGNIIWINAESKESLKKSFCRLAEVLKVLTIEKIGKKEQERSMGSIINDIYKYFDLIKGLLIFDNAEEYEDIREFLPSSDKKLNILITSRNKKWEETIALGAFTEKEAIEYIKKALDINLQSNDIQKLAEKLLCYPLALSQAVSYIKRRNETERMFGRKFKCGNCLEEYEKMPEKLLSCELECTDSGYPKTTLTIWKSTIEKIKQKEYGQEALTILETVACLDSNKIPVEELVSKLKVNEKKLCNAIELLEQYSMIEVKEGVLSIYKLVWQVIRLGMQKQGKECPKT